MAVEKSELKKLIYHELGVRMEDMFESAQRQKEQFSGGKQAVGEVRKKVEALLAQVDEDKDLRDIEEVANCKRYIKRILALVESYVENLQKQELLTQGRSEQSSLVVKLLSAAIKEETKKAEMREAAPEKERRAVGTKPKDKLKSRKRKSKKKVEADGANEES